MKSVYYVYEYVDPRNDEVFYVGKGKGKRVYNTYEKHRNEFFTRKCKSIERDGHKATINIVKDCLTESDAFDIEYELIMKYKRVEDGGTLTNLKIGWGRGATHTSNHTLEKLSKINQGTLNSANIYSEDEIIRVMDLIVEGCGNTEIERITGIDNRQVSAIRYNKRWKHLFEKHPISKIPAFKSNGMCGKINLESQLEIIDAIVNRGNKLLKDIATEYAMKSNTIVQINLRKSWKIAWKIYDTRR